MSPNLPLQSCFLYQGKWSQEIDTVIIDTLLRLKKEYECDGCVFPSHFIFEAQSLVEYHVGLTFEWWELVDRIHFLDRRYRTFNELVRLEGTHWNEATNTMIVSGDTWANHLPRNHLMGAYHSYGEPAYHQLHTLFGIKANTQELEPTLIILSDTEQSHVNVDDATQNNGHLEEGGVVNSLNKFSFARRKLMFDDGGLQDLESTNKKPECYYIPGANGTTERVREQYTGRVLP